MFCKKTNSGKEYNETGATTFYVQEHRLGGRTGSEVRGSRETGVKGGQGEPNETRSELREDRHLRGLRGGPKTVLTRRGPPGPR